MIFQELSAVQSEQVGWWLTKTVGDESRDFQE